MKAKNYTDGMQIWWEMVHVLDFIKFTFLDLEDAESRGRAERAYNELMDISNKYHDTVKKMPF